MPGGSGTNCQTQAGVGGIYHILKTLSTQVLTVVVLRVFSAKQLVLRCRLCPQETGVWKYSLLQHFEQFHEGCDLLQEEVLA